MTLAKRRNETEVQVTPPDEIGNGSATVSTPGTAVPLSATSVGCRFVNVFAKATNDGNVFVGGSTVSNISGAVLEQARCTEWFGIDDLSKVFVDAETGGDGVQYIYVV